MQRSSGGEEGGDGDGDVPGAAAMASTSSSSSSSSSKEMKVRPASIQKPGSSAANTETSMTHASTSTTTTTGAGAGAAASTTTTTTTTATDGSRAVVATATTTTTKTVPTVPLERPLSFVALRRETEEQRREADDVTEPDAKAKAGTAVSGKASTKSQSAPLQGGSETLDEEQQQQEGMPRVLVVTGCLPVQIDFVKKKVEYSEGGVARALLTLKGVELVGYVPAPKSERKWISDKLSKNGWHPVFLSEEVGNTFLQNFSNNLLYSVFHYMPLPMGSAEILQDAFECYQKANEEVAKVVLRLWNPGDLVWVHDYPLLLLPNILRKKQPSMLIGYFLHIPFPTSEIYRILPVRTELLEGVLGADLIGFQIHEYARHFESACVRVLGVHAMDGIVVRGNEQSTITTCPIGIDTQRFADALESKEVKALVRQLEADYKGRKVLLGFDRFDHIKGIPHKLYAIERFLKENPHWIGNVVLLQVASAWNKDTPKSEVYTALNRQCHEIVGRINGRFGTLSSMPIHYLQKNVTFPELVALYRVADALVISSVRDGMNLVAHEYVTCQQEKNGVLILSEFTGAAKSLGAGSLQVNPWNVQSFGSVIRYALEMPAPERERLHKYAYRYVMRHSTTSWARRFLHDLLEFSPKRNDHTTKKKLPELLDVTATVSSFKKAKHRLLITGLGGTLTPPTGRDQDIKRTPSYQSNLNRVPSSVRKYVCRLAQDPKTTVVVISNATREELQNAFGDSEVWLAAENGFFLKRGKEDPHWHVLFDSIDLTWKLRVKKVFQYFKERTPRSFIREHETTCSWHYHDAQRGLAAKQANDLMIHLRGGILSNTSTEVQDTDAAIQIRPVGLSKGAAVQKIFYHYHKWMKTRPFSPSERSDPPRTRAVDFVMCIGNLTKLDEDLFLVVNATKTTPIPMVTHNNFFFSCSCLCSTLT